MFNDWVPFLAVNLLAVMVYLKIMRTMFGRALLTSGVVTYLLLLFSPFLVGIVSLLVYGIHVIEKGSTQRSSSLLNQAALFAIASLCCLAIGQWYADALLTAIERPAADFMSARTLGPDW
jgi:hypothetical protein